MLMHEPATLHRCQRYEKVIGVAPPHVPSDVVSVELTAGVPVITGTALFDGAPVVIGGGGGVIGGGGGVVGGGGGGVVPEDGIVTVTAFDAAPRLPAASTARTVYVGAVPAAGDVSV